MIDKGEKVCRKPSGSIEVLKTVVNFDKLWCRRSSRGMGGGWPENQD